MAISDRERTGFIKEVTPGTNPSGNQQLLRVTSNNLAMNQSFVKSAFLRADTNEYSSVRVGRGISGSLGIQLSYGDYEDLYEGLLRGTYSTPTAYTGTDVSFTTSTNVITAASGSPFTNVLVGHWIYVSGDAAPANNGWMRVTAKSSAQSVTVNRTLTTASAGASITIKGSTLVNGTTLSTYSFERGFIDNGDYIEYTGVVVDSISHSLALQQIATGTINLTGRNSQAGTSSYFSGTVGESTTVSLNTVDNIAAVEIDGTATTAELTAMDFSISSNASPLFKIGSLTAKDIKQYTFMITGNMTAYFNDLTSLYSKVNTNTPFDFAFATTDEAGNKTLYHMPNVRLLTSALDNQGRNTETSETYSFEATVDETLGHTLSISVSPA